MHKSAHTYFADTPIRCRSIIMIWLAAVCFIQVAAAAGKAPARSEVIAGCDVASFRNAMELRGADAVEGIWYYVDDGATIGIERVDDDVQGMKYRLIMLESEDMSVIPGSVIGYVQRSAMPDKAYMYIYSGVGKDGVPTHPVRCVATLSGDGTRLTFATSQPYKFKLRVNFSRIMPSFFKALSLSAEPNHESLPKGMVKVYPGNGGTETHSKIIYL